VGAGGTSGPGTQRSLARALARPVGQGLAELHWAPSATWADLQDLLLDGEWHVLHFIGHGDFDPGQDEGRAGHDPRGRAPRPGRRAPGSLTCFARPPDAAPGGAELLLRRCGRGEYLFSGTAAVLVRGGVSAVNAMQYEISDHAAVAFARGFYADIARGRGVDDAVSSGRVAILGLSDRTLEWVTPVLYLRGHDSQLFTLPAPAEDTNREGAGTEDTGSSRGAQPGDTISPARQASRAGTAPLAGQAHGHRSPRRLRSRDRTWHAPSPATTVGSGVWRSARTAGCSPSAAASRRRCEMWPPAGFCAPSLATTARSAVWRSARTGGCSPSAASSRRGCGMWPPASVCAPSPMKNLTIFSGGCRPTGILPPRPGGRRLLWAGVVGTDSWGEADG
jgi:hypothetical protein